jgi:selenium metabolism protein YedF
MAAQINAKGLECPKPVLLAKKALDEGNAEVEILVDNTIAVQNLTRLAQSGGRNIKSAPIEGGFAVTISGDTGNSREQVPLPVINCAPESGYAVFIGKDHVGDGDLTLGYNLMKMFLYSLSQSDNLPNCVLFMNAGVKLAAGGEQQVVDSIKTLAERGVRVLVCGTCLNFFGLTEQLAVGAVSNMYEILSAMQQAGKVITV